jgi:hypothetical protein
LTRSTTVPALAWIVALSSTNWKLFAVSGVEAVPRSVPISDPRYTLRKPVLESVSVICFVPPDSTLRPEASPPVSVTGLYAKPITITDPLTGNGGLLTPALTSRSAALLCRPAAATMAGDPKPTVYFPGRVAVP